MKQFFRDLPIRFKLLFGFLIIALCVIPLGYLENKNLTNVLRTMSDIVDDSSKGLQALIELHQQASDIFIILDTHSGVNEEQAVLLPQLYSFLQWHQEYNNYLYETSKSAMRQTVSISAVTFALQQVMEILNHVYIANIYHADTFRASMLDELKDLFYEIDFLLKIAINKEVNEINDRLQRVNEMAKRVNEELIGIIVFIILLSIGMSILLMQYITKPVMELKHHAIQLIEGGDLHVQVPVHSKDEIGQLALSFNQLIQRLATALETVGVASKVKSDFLTMISHELRTPLNIVSGFTQCLLMEIDGPISLKQRESLNKIEKGSQRVLEMINAILELVQMDRQTKQLVRTDTDIEVIIEDCLKEVEGLIGTKELVIETSIERPLKKVNIDMGLIRQVIYNLLSNAIKFTEKGKVSITVHGLKNGVEISFSDTGIGIDKEEQAKIFHPFAQVDSSITRRYEGMGLGLIMSQKIIEMHQGSIKLISEKGKGSTFIIFVPYGKSSFNL